MLFFFVGENFCAANYLLTAHHDSFVLEYLHGFGMLLCFGFSVFAVFEGVDHVVSRPTPTVDVRLRRCVAAVRNTNLCPAASSGSFVGLAAALVAWILWSSTLVRSLQYRDSNLYSYVHLTAYQLYEMRYFLMIGSLAFLIGAAVLGLKHEAPNRVSRSFSAALEHWDSRSFDLVCSQRLTT
jgi:hypothetical protein